MTNNVAILVLNHNGRDLLARCLPTVVRAAAFAGPGCRVVVIDNRSTDDSVSFIRAAFPAVEVTIASKNNFLFSYNETVRACPEDVVIILNNDMQVAEDFLSPLMIYFSDPKVFAVTCRIHNWNGRDGFNQEAEPIWYLRTHRGWFEKYYEPAPTRPRHVMFASGGASAFRREMFVTLEGFNPIFRPGYSEDSDLSYRAWKRGWKVVYAPNSAVFHFDSVSMKRRYGIRRELIALRNQILMMAMDCGDVRFLIRFLSFYPKRLLQHWLFGDRALGKAMFMASTRLPRALIHRATRCILREPVLAEKDILSAISRPLSEL